MKEGANDNIKHMTEMSGTLVLCTRVLRFIHDICDQLPVSILLLLYFECSEYIILTEHKTISAGQRQKWWTNRHS